MLKQVVIIGNGISGITTARIIRKKSDCRITVISAESDHFYSRTALMYIFMGQMKYEHTKPYEDWFWEKNKIELKRGFVSKVNTEEQLLTFSDGSTMNYDELVLATGSHPKMVNWPGGATKGIQGMVNLQDLEKLEENIIGIKKAVVVGGGLIGIELIEMLASRKIEVFFIVRDFKFWSNVLPAEESLMIQEHMRDHHIHLLLQTEIKEVLADENGRVKAIRTSNDQTIECQFVGVTIGVEPNIDFLKDSGIKLGKGILVNNYLETNIKNVYAVGDCAEFSPVIPGRPPIEQIWYTGKMQGECLGRTIAGERTPYHPVNFYNSAKLLDIEYQIYSEDVIIPRETEHFFWKSDDSLKSMRFYFDLATKRFLGVVVLGIRYRHEVCNRWLKEKRDIEYVLQHLQDANFDSEFYRHYENEILFVYNNKYNRNVEPLKKSWARILNWK